MRMSHRKIFKTETNNLLILKVDKRTGSAHLPSKSISMLHHRTIIWFPSQQIVGIRCSNRHREGSVYRVPRIAILICSRTRSLQCQMGAKVSDWGLNPRNLPRYASAVVVNKPNRTHNANRSNYRTQTLTMSLTRLRIIHKKLVCIISLATLTFWIVGRRLKIRIVNTSTTPE